MKVAEVCRKYGISDARYYNWKAKFGGMTVSEAQRLKTLEAENGRLKRLLAEAMLDNAALKDSWPKVVSPQARRAAVTHLMTAHQLGVTRAGGLAGISSHCIAMSRRDPTIQSRWRDSRCWQDGSGAMATGACMYCCAGKDGVSIASARTGCTVLPD
jgi:putative transposase